MNWLRVTLLSTLAIMLGYALGMGSRSDSTAQSTGTAESTFVPESEVVQPKAATLLSVQATEPGISATMSEGSPSSDQVSHVQSSVAAIHRDAEMRTFALNEGLQLSPERTSEEQLSRLEKFIEALHDPIRDGLAFYGVDKIQLGGKLTEIRALLNFYNGSKHGEDLTQLKDACWSVQIEIEGDSSGALQYGAGCGRTTGLLEDRLYVHAEISSIKIKPSASLIAFPLPDGSKSGDLQVFSTNRKKWLKGSDWSWTTISGEEFKRHEEELRRRASENR